MKANQITNFRKCIKLVRTYQQTRQLPRFTRRSVRKEQLSLSGNIPTSSYFHLYKITNIFITIYLFSGYIGHIASRHSELLSDSSPVLTNAQIEASTKEKPQYTPPEVKEEPDPELVIPKTSVPNYQTTIIRHVSKTTESKKPYRAKGMDINKFFFPLQRARYLA